VPYSVLPITNATSYNWLYTSFPGRSAIIHGTSNNITIDFQGSTVNGVLSVNGLSYCPGIASSIAIGTLDINDITRTNFHMVQNIANPATGLCNIEYNLPTSGET